MNNQTYDKITAQIIAQMERGTIPWKKTWSAGQQAINYVTRKPYQGVNVLLLPEPGEYLTFNQVKELKGYVRQGEKANMVCFWKILEDTDDKGKIKTIPLLRYYYVFHLSQCEGIKTKIIDTGKDNSTKHEPEAVVNKYVSNSGLTFKPTKGSLSAYYSPVRDMVVVPDIQQFDSAEAYYSTAFHELVHSTGHSSRLDRFSKNGDQYFGSELYSKEELTAEIGAAFLNEHTGINTVPLFNNTIAYLQGWIKVLKNDTKMIVHASGQATKAVNMILGFEPTF